MGCSSLVPTFRRGPPDESLLIEGDLGSSPPHGLWPEVLLGEAAGPLAHLRWVGLCMEAVEGQGGTDRAQSEAWGPDPPGSAAQFRPKHEVHLRASDPGRGAGTWQRKELQKRVQMRGGSHVPSLHQTCAFPVSMDLRAVKVTKKTQLKSLR